MIDDDLEIKHLLLRASDPVASRDVDPAVYLRLGRAARRRRSIRLAGLAGGTVALVVVVVSLLVAQLGKSSAPIAGSPEQTVATTAPFQTTALGTAVAEPTGESLFTDGRYSAQRPALCQYPEIAFSSEGLRVAVACVDGFFNGLNLIDLPDGAPRPLITGDVRGVAWTSDDTQLVVAHDGTLEIVDADPSKPSTRTVELPVGWVVNGIDINSADVVVLSGTVDQVAAIMTVDLDATQPRVLLSDPDSTIWSPRWSPDGNTIAFLNQNGADGDIGDVSVRAANVDGTNVRVVIQYGAAAFLGIVPSLDWSPSGRIAFTTAVNARGTVVILSPDETVEQVLSGNGPVVWQPAP